MSETPTQAKPRTQAVRIAPGSPYAAPTVLLGEQIIADASRVSVDFSAGTAPRVFLEFDGEEVAPLDLDAVVYITKEIKQDPAEACLQFLEPIDPAELQRCTLEIMEPGGPETFGEAALEVLRRWARGD